MARLVRLAIAAALVGGLTACAGAPDSFDTRNIPDEARDSAVSTPDTPLQCVPYARAHSGINIYGDAYTWWDKAAGHFARGAEPKTGAVLVLAGYAGANRAHLAVVHDIVSSREIRVDHANWLDDGAIYTNDPVVDVSPDNDWSAVKVWNIRASAWGTRTYGVQGFIGPGPEDMSDRVARNAAPLTSDDPSVSDDADEADR
jgi:hypothetical protein